MSKDSFAGVDSFFNPPLNKESNKTDRDKLHQLQKHKVFLREEINRLITPEVAPELFTHLRNSVPTNLTDFYTNYKIPVFALNILEEIKTGSEDIKICLKPSTDPLFNGPVKAHAAWRDWDNTIYLKEENYTPAARVLAWLIGVEEVSGALEEESIEHELRHAWFSKHMSFEEGEIAENFGIEEACALSTKWGFRIEDLYQHYGLLYRMSKQEAEDRQVFMSLFALAKVKQVDEEELVKEMNNKSMWGRVIDLDYGRAVEIYTDRTKILTGALRWMGVECEDPTEYLKNNPELRKYQKRLVEDLVKWKLEVWERVYEFLGKQDRSFKARWLDECEMDEE